MARNILLKRLSVFSVRYLALFIVFFITTAGYMQADSYGATVGNVVFPVDVTDTSGTPEALLMGITLTEGDVRNIQKAADGSGQKYVRIGVGQVCISSNDSTGMPLALTVTKLVADDVTLNTDSADLLLAVFSATTPNSALDAGSGAVRVVYASSENQADFPVTFDALGRNGLTPPLHAGAGQGYDFLSITKSDTIISSYGDTSTATFLPIVHLGVTTNTVTYSSGFENGASQANGVENVKLVGCDSTLTLVLHIKADDILHMRAGLYKTSITLDAHAAAT
jgi:hypothetical protein